MQSPLLCTMFEFAVVTGALKVYLDRGNAMNYDIAALVAFLVLFFCGEFVVIFTLTFRRCFLDAFELAPGAAGDWSKRRADTLVRDFLHDAAQANPKAKPKRE